MPRPAALFFYQAICFSVLGCGREQAKPPNLEGTQFHRLAGGEPRQDGWYEAKSTGGGFAVLLPGPFNDFSRPGVSKNGGKIITHGVGMNTPRGVKYLALVMRSVDGEELPKSTREDLAATADRAGTLKGKREVFCEGLRGIELYIMETKTGIKTRRYDAEKIRYILTAEFPSNIAEEVLAEVDTFINSLKLPR